MTVSRVGFSAFPFWCLLLVEKSPLFDSLACGTVLEHASQSRLSESDLADRIDCVQGRIPRRRSGALDRPDQAPHRSLVLLRANNSSTGWPGSSGSSEPHPKPRMGPFSVAIGACGRFGGPISKHGFQEMVPFSQLGLPFASQKTHESLKNTKNPLKHPMDRPNIHVV